MKQKIEAAGFKRRVESQGKLQQVGESVPDAEKGSVGKEEGESKRCAGNKRG